MRPVERYALKERGRLIGEFSPAELTLMAERNQLTRFHEVSTRGARWESAIEVLERLQLQKNIEAATAREPLPPIPSDTVVSYRPFPVWLLVVLHYATFGVFSFFWITSMHGRLPRNTPDEPGAGRAVALMLIPLVNLYWMFICYPLLVERLNTVRERRGLPTDVLTFPALLMCVGYLAASLMAIAGTLVVFTLTIRQSAVEGTNWLERSEHAIWFFFVMPQFLTAINYLFLAPQFASMCQTAFNQIAELQQRELTTLLAHR